MWSNRFSQRMRMTRQFPGERRSEPTGAIASLDHVSTLQFALLKQVEH